MSDGYFIVHEHTEYRTSWTKYLWYSPDWETACSVREALIVRFPQLESRDDRATERVRLQKLEETPTGAVLAWNDRLDAMDRAMVTRQDPASIANAVRLPYSTVEIFLYCESVQARLWASLTEQVGDEPTAEPASTSDADLKVGYSTQAAPEESRSAPEPPPASDRSGQRRRLDREVLNTEAREHLRGNVDMKIKELAQRLDVSVGVVAELPAWKAVVARRREERPASPRTIALTDGLVEMLAAEQDADQKRYKVLSRRA